MEYKEQLQTNQWKRKRLRILKRDNYKCTNCGSNESLCVHHMLYIKGRLAWEYHEKYLTTLCNSCHYDWHCKNETEVIKVKSKFKGKDAVKSKPKKKKLTKEEKEKAYIKRYAKKNNIKL